MKFLFALAILLFSLHSYAALDLSKYELTTSQIETIRMFEARGKSEEFLLKLVHAFEKSNKKKPVYIPAHTRADLEAVSNWATGGAFFTFCQYAGCEFDVERYKADCPSWEIFNFGKATGKEYFRVDVLESTLNLLTNLQFSYANDKSEDKAAFKKTFFNYMKIYKMEKYLK